MPLFNPPIPYIDRTDNLTLTEKLGTVVSLTRRVRVLFKEVVDAGPGDFSILDIALTACPAAFSVLDENNFRNLVLVERVPRLVEGDFVVDVDLKYEHFMDGHNQILTSDRGGAGGAATAKLYGKGKASITEKKTNFYYPGGDTTKPRKLILTGHTYTPQEWAVLGETPAQHPSGPLTYIINTPDGKFGNAAAGTKVLLPFTVLQGGEINLPFPQANYSLQGVIYTNNPWGIVFAIVNCINNKSWVGRPPHTWLCSEVSFEVLDVDVTPPVEKAEYKFSFEFQYNQDTWDPDVIYKDKRYKGPPPSAATATVASDPASGALDSVPATAPYIYAPVNSTPNITTPPDPFGHADLQVRLTWLGTAVNNVPVVGTSEVQPATYAFDPVTKKLLPAAPPQFFIQPADYWKVPALKPVDFSAFFTALFEL